MKTIEQTRIEIIKRIENARLCQCEIKEYGNYQYFNGKINAYEALMRYIDGE